MCIVSDSRKLSFKFNGMHSLLFILITAIQINAPYAIKVFEGVINGVSLKKVKAIVNE